MNFELKNGLIWITLEIVYEGNIVTVDNCILDTGSATTAIDIDTVNFNWEKSSFIRRIQGLGGGTQEVICQEIDKLVVNKIDLTNIEIEFGNIESNFGIRGFLGNDVLKNFIVTIDYSKKEIDLILKSCNI